MKSFFIGDIEIKMPVIQGGMGVGISLSGLASAVANEGGLGVISCAGLGLIYSKGKGTYLEKCIGGLREEIRKARMKTTGVIGVNVMVALSNYANMVRTAIEEKIDVVFSGAGLPLDLPSYLVPGSTTKLVPIVSSSRAAKIICDKWNKNYNYLPDAIVVEGPKAGGHLGFSRQELEKPPTLSVLLPEVLEALAPFRDRAGRDIPVFVAGGVKNGAEMAAYMRQGAAGAQFATRFIVTKECDASRAYKERLIAAEASDITLVKSPVGMPGRALCSPLIRRVETGTQPPPERCMRCITTCDGKNAPYCISKALIAARNGDWENGLFFCGENAGEIKTLSTVPAEMARIVEEWRSAQ